MDTMLAQLLAQPAWLVYGVVGMVILLEGAVPAGVLLPGEATALLGGATVALGASELVPMVLVVVVAAAVVNGSPDSRSGSSTEVRSRLSAPGGRPLSAPSSPHSPEPPGCRTAGSPRGTHSER